MESRKLEVEVFGETLDEVYRKVGKIERHVGSFRYIVDDTSAQKPDAGGRWAYVTTVQLLIAAKTDDQAVDVVMGTLAQDNILDWGFLKLGGQNLYPTEIYIPRGYQEGDAFN